MLNTEVEQGVKYLISGLPAEVLTTLSKVDVQIYADPSEAANALKTAIPNDAKGVFIGQPVEFADPDEEQDQDSFTIAAPAEGVIALISGNLQKREEVPIVLLHEIGHALDMDEDEVKALGLSVSEAIKETEAKNAKSVQPGPAA